MRKVLLVACVTLLFCGTAVAQREVMNPGDPQEYEGAVLIVSHAHSVLTIIDANPRDGIVDHVFSWMTEQTPDSLRVSLRNAHVRFERDQLRVSDGNTIYVFSIGTASAAAPAGNGSATVFGNGAGLSHYWNEVANRGRLKDGPDGYLVSCGGDSPDTGGFCINDWGGAGGGGANCQAGGKPATSCSISAGSSSCSVSCPAGYYACCNIEMFSAECSCIKN